VDKRVDEVQDYDYENDEYVEQEAEDAEEVNSERVEVQSSSQNEDTVVQAQLNTFQETVPKQPEAKNPSVAMVSIIFLISHEFIR
jgi:hypothetical protein